MSDVSSVAHLNTFNINSLQDDIALLFLKTGLPANKSHNTIEAIALAELPTPSSSVCQISGWGRTEIVRILLTCYILSFWLWFFLE